MSITTGSSGYGGGFDSGAHGTARWMSAEEAAAVDLYTYHPRPPIPDEPPDPIASIVLGQDSRGRLCFLNRQGHVLVLAPPRTGKGVGFVQSNLAMYAGSMVVTDPKGENAAVSYKYRQGAFGGQNVVVLDPTGKLASYGIDPPVPTHAFNPLLAFDNADYVQVIDDIGLMVDALLVPAENEKEPHWRDGAQSFLTGILTYMTFFEETNRRNLPMLSRFANGLEVTHDELFTILRYNDHPDPAMRDVIARTGAWWENVNPKERASFVSVALRSLAWLNTPVWQDHLTRSDFHPYDLKKGRTTVYIVCPFDKLEQYSAWFRLVLSCCIVAVIRAPKKSPRPTLFMLDEYAATIGRLAMLERSIPFIEGVGGRFAMIFQYLSQMNTLWPDPDFHGKFASAGAHVFFNVNDAYTSNYISQYIGKYGAESHGAGGISHVARDRLTPDEVRALPENDQIVFLRNHRPAWLGKLNVRRHKKFEGRLLDNPTYDVQPDAIEAGEETRRTRTVLSADAARLRKGGDIVVNDNAFVMLVKKYPEKDLRFRDDLLGYDETERNPTTGLVETFFMPVAHRSVLDLLGL